jgi:ATP-dependent exoDNAse (exonuclease V) alpha subunit
MVSAGPIENNSLRHLRRPSFLRLRRLRITLATLELVIKPGPQATVIDHGDTKQAPATSNGSPSITSEQPVEQSAQDLLDISSSSEEEGEITNNLQQEVTEATTTCETEHGNTDEQLTKLR